MHATIAVLPGDGVGPEIIVEAKKVLDTVASQFGHTFDYVEGLIGGCAIDATGNPLPDETIEICKSAKGILLGAVGGPKWDNPLGKVRPEQGLLGIRKALNVYANLRPVKIYPELSQACPLRQDLVEGVDLLVIRELTGGIYFGESGRKDHESGEQAWDTMIYSTGEVERIVRRACQAAQARNGRLASVDKANVLEVSRLWRATAEKVVKNEFPDLEYENVLVDAASMYLIQQPRRFDVIVTGNMFGDIITDEASVLAGSMGMLPSASLGDGGMGLYEPIHGSAPDIAGQGIANPIGMILSAAMLCRYTLGLEAEAEAIENAVDAVLADGIRTADLTQEGEAPASTAAMGTSIATAIKANVKV